MTHKAINTFFILLLIIFTSRIVSANTVLDISVTPGSYGLLDIPTTVFRSDENANFGLVSARNGNDARIDLISIVDLMRYTIVFSAIDGEIIGINHYDDAADEYYRRDSTRPGLSIGSSEDFGSPAIRCYNSPFAEDPEAVASFNIRELVIDANVITQFAVDFEQSCEGDGPLLSGSIRHNSDLPIGAAQNVLGGSATGMEVRKLVCKNMITEQKIEVKIPAQTNVFTYDCKAAGLNVEPGDRVRMTVIGFGD